MKYNISKEFGILRYLTTTLNPFVLRFASGFMKLLPKGMRSNKALNITRFAIETRDNKKINVYRIVPKGVSGKIPTLIFFHGGAFAFRGAPYHYKYAKLYAERLSCQIFFVDYRLSFNNEFLVPLNDSVDAYRYILDRAEEFSVDTDRIGFVGDSAGGYLSMMTAITAKEEGLRCPKVQMLIYPVIDTRSNTQSMARFIDTPCWNSKLNKKMWEIYLKGNSIKEVLDYDLSYFTTSYIEVAEFDCLRDEGIAVFDKIHKEYIDSILIETRGTMHGFDGVFSSAITKNCIESRIEFLTKNL